MSTNKQLGEIALRVENLDVMQSFYEDTIGLELIKRFPNSAFFKIAEGLEGHTQILALFDRSTDQGYVGLRSDYSTIDHIAFSISLDDYELEKERLENIGLPVRTSEHAWVQWRSLYIYDPEGNEVEFVCFDPNILSE
jgi:catechol 2,3-dioxygenase